MVMSDDDGGDDVFDVVDDDVDMMMILMIILMVRIRFEFFFFMKPQIENYCTYKSSNYQLKKTPIKLRTLLYVRKL